MTLTLLTAAISGVGAVLLHWLPQRWQWLAAAGILLVVTPITLVGFWPNGRWGISDWDYYFSYHTAIYRMVVDQGVFPQWNPYICGGTSAIGDPEFPVFAPTFVLELLFGIPLGLRLAIFSITVFGALGMLLLARRLGLAPPAALLAAIAFSFGGINLLEIVEGHPNVFSAYYLPWIFWSWTNAYNTPPKSTLRNVALWPFVCGIFLALTFFQGGIYMLMYVGLAFLFLILVLPHRLRSLYLTLFAGLWAVGLAAIKIAPVMLWLRQFPDKAYASSTYLLPSLHKVLLGRYVHGSENVISNQGGGWHEYGAFIGITILVLALISLTQLRRRSIRLLWLGALLAVLLASSGPLLKPIFDILPFLPRSNISRFMIMAILPLTLLSGIGLQALLPRRKWAVLVATPIITLATLELTSYAAILSQQAFILDPTPTSPPPPAPIAYTINQHITRVNGVDFSRAFAGAEAGYGTLSYCSVLGPEPAVRVIEDPEGNPYLTIPNNNGHAELISWSPQEIRLSATIHQPSEVVLNANHAPGWWVNGEPARENSGRLASPSLPAGTHLVTFIYRAPGLGLGAAITSITLLAAAIYVTYFLYHKVRERRA